jgi:DNA-binding MurR/RpiR family transcriptional regulator
MASKTFFQHLSENYRNLSDSEKEVVDYIMKYEAIETLKIKMIEQELFISSTTVVRACKKLGYPTFNAFKYALINRKENQEEQHHITETTFQELAQLKQNDMLRTLKLLEEDKIELVADKLLNARQVFCVATGSSTIVAQDFSRKLKLIDIWANKYSEKFPLERMRANATKDDVILTISLSGQDEDINRRLLETKKNGPLLISITNLSANPLVTLSDISLFVYTSQSKGTKLRSRLSLYVACDLVFDMLMLHRNSREKKMTQ